MVIERSSFMATAFGSGYAGENNFPSVWVSIAFDLIPNVFLVPFNLVLAQQRAQFVLKIQSCGDVLPDPRCIPSPPATSIGSRSNPRRRLATRSRRNGDRVPSATGWRASA